MPKNYFFGSPRGGFNVIKVTGNFKSCKLSDFFSLKSCVPLSLSANVVYKFTCLLCDTETSYIGKTERHLLTRVAEHLSTGENNKSAIASHRRQCVPCRNATINNFQILRRSDKNNVYLHEAMLIRQQQPTLNVQVGSWSGANCLLKVFN